VYEVFETAEQRDLARELARKSMVLLKNDGMLPLSKTIRTLAVIGPNAHNPRNQMGDYSYAAKRELMAWNTPANSAFVNVDNDELAEYDVRVVTALSGIKSMVSAETKILYARGCNNLGSDLNEIEEAVQIAKQADAVVLVLGDHSGLTPEATTGETRDSSDLKLPGMQDDLAQAVLSTGKPVAVILITGRPYALTSIAERTNAILEAWLPGEEGGSALADILFGDFNPGGKLAMTFPRSVGQVPVFYSAKPSGTRSNWYVDYVSEKVTPLYPFGHGLSYTAFEYSNLHIEQNQVAAGQSVRISLDLQNTGNVAGEEVVQLYTHDEFASTPRPIKELKGYTRLMLQPGETRTITFHLPVNQLAFYDLDLNLIVEAGKIHVMVGSSSADIRLCGQFEIVGEQTTKVADRVFVCPVSVK
jgi:beta-glucosidase